MFMREALTATLVLLVLASGSASQNLANVLGRADFGISRKADDRRAAVLP